MAGGGSSDKKTKIFNFQKTSHGQRASLRKQQSTIWNSFLHLPIINFLYRHKNFCFLVLALLALLSITHVPYVGTFLDSFVFATLFGYFRYPFYCFIFFTLIIFVLHLEQKEFLRYTIYFLAFLIVLGSAWSFVIALDINHKPHTTFADCWLYLKQSYSGAWHNAKHAFQNYDSMPGGAVGVFIYSCFYMFHNPTVAQVLFWIVTIIIFLLCVGYFIFQDFFFVIKCGDALRLICAELWTQCCVKTMHKSRSAVARQLVKNKKPYSLPRTSTEYGKENFFYHLKQEKNPLKYAKTKQLLPRSHSSIYDPDDRIDNSFADKTREIIRGTMLRNLTKKKSKDQFNEYQNKQIDVNLMKNNMNTFFMGKNNSQKHWFNKRQKNNSTRDEKKSTEPFSSSSTLITLRDNLIFFKYNRQRYNFSHEPFDFNKLHFRAKQQNRSEVRVYARRNENILLQIFLANKIPAQVAKINISNKFIQYEMTIPNNIMVNRIRALRDNIRLGLSEQNVFIEIPLKDRNTFGVQIPNPFAAIVTFKDIFGKMFTSGDYKKLRHKLFIGQKSNGENLIARFSNMPHLLIAGATGSGKSVELRNIILSLALSNHPHELNLILIDPKKVEFRTFYDLPHLLTPIIYSYEKIVFVLDKLILEMENRYKVLQKFKCINIDEYNQRQTDKSLRIPKIIVIFDEFADFILQGRQQLEMKIVRISQLSRAAGIHLILATQRPSSKVITGLIKINFPCRMAFACSSGIDSRIIIDKVGAEELLGNGDMLYISSSNYRPIRLQAPFVDQVNTDILSNFLRGQASPIYVNELNIDYEENAILHEQMLQKCQKALTWITSQETINRATLQRIISIPDKKFKIFFDLLLKGQFLVPTQVTNVFRVTQQSDSVISSMIDDSVSALLRVS